jgi:hypothetical protein
MYRLRAAGLAHRSCFDHLHQTLARFGIRLGHTPASICLFQILNLFETGEVLSEGVAVIEVGFSGSSSQLTSPAGL